MKIILPIWYILLFLTALPPLFKIWYNPKLILWSRHYSHYSHFTREHWAYQVDVTIVGRWLIESAAKQLYDCLANIHSFLAPPREEHNILFQWCWVWSWDLTYPVQYHEINRGLKGMCADWLALWHFCHHHENSMPMLPTGASSMKGIRNKCELTSSVVPTPVKLSLDLLNTCTLDKLRCMDKK